VRRPLTKVVVKRNSTKSDVWQCQDSTDHVVILDRKVKPSPQHVTPRNVHTSSDLKDDHQQSNPPKAGARSTILIIGRHAKQLSGRSHEALALTAKWELESLMVTWLLACGFATSLRGQSSKVRSVMSIKEVCFGRQLISLGRQQWTS
jgi:hypothetical protein